jgi:hypothetical protein
MGVSTWRTMSCAVTPERATSPAAAAVRTPTDGGADQPRSTTLVRAAKSWHPAHWCGANGAVDASAVQAIHNGTARTILRPSRNAAAAIRNLKATCPEEIEIDIKTGKTK